jgi:hypothetical protein
LPNFVGDFLGAPTDSSGGIFVISYSAIYFLYIITKSSSVPLAFLASLNIALEIGTNGLSFFNSGQ